MYCDEMKENMNKAMATTPTIERHRHNMESKNEYEVMSVSAYEKRRGWERGKERGGKR